MTAMDVIQNSVTKNDYNQNAAVYTLQVLGGQGIRPSIPNNPPEYWSFSRDAVLKRTVLVESGWANAIYIAVTKVAGMSFRLRGPKSPAEFFRDMFITADGNRGFTQFLSKHLRDYLTTDNGAFIEIVRAKQGASGSRIIGLMHLSSLRCYRTRDPERPVMYRDRAGAMHYLRDYEVIHYSDMPDPDDIWNGVGWCAASRCYRDIYNAHVMETYLGEKMTGQKPLSIYFVNNTSIGQIEQAVTSAESQRRAKGYVSYMGAVIVPNLDPTAAPSVGKIDLAGLPDGFVPAEERKKTNLSYANSIGLDPQDLDPQLLASKSLGTGAQSRIIDDKASGKGLVSWKQEFTQAINEMVLPSSTTFYFNERDYRDRLQEATVEKLRTDIQVARVSSGIIDPSMALQLLVDAEDVPPEFLAYDITPVEDIGGDSNPPQKQIGGGPGAPGIQAPPPSISSEAGQNTRDIYSPRDNAVSSAKESRQKVYREALANRITACKEKRITPDEFRLSLTKLNDKLIEIAYLNGKQKAVGKARRTKTDDTMIANCQVFAAGRIDQIANAIDYKEVSAIVDNDDFVDVLEGVEWNGYNLYKKA